MRVIAILLFGIALCLILGKTLFEQQHLRRLQVVFYGLALAQTVMLVFIVFLAVVGEDVF